MPFVCSGGIQPLTRSFIWLRLGGNDKYLCKISLQLMKQFCSNSRYIKHAKHGSVDVWYVVEAISAIFTYRRNYLHFARAVPPIVIHLVSKCVQDDSRRRPTVSA